MARATSPCRSIFEAEHGLRRPCHEIYADGPASSSPCALVCSRCAASAQTVELVNNQPFDIRMPLTVRGVKLTRRTAPLAQQAGERLDRHGRRAGVAVDATLSLGPVAQQASPRRRRLKPDGDGVAITAGGKDMGRLTWGVVVDQAPADAKKGEPQPSTKRDFAAAFKPVALKFDAHRATGRCSTRGGRAARRRGLKLDVELHAYHSRLPRRDVDGHERVGAARKTSTPPSSAAGSSRRSPARTLCYDNRRQELDDGAYSPFRARRGASPVHPARRRLGQHASRRRRRRRAGCNDFTPSFTSTATPSEDAKKDKLGAALGRRQHRPPRPGSAGEGRRALLDHRDRPARTSSSTRPALAGQRPARRRASR